MGVDLDDLNRRAVAALSLQDADGALRVVLPAIEAGSGDASTQLIAAYAWALKAEFQKAQAAADKCLKDEPQNLRALLLKADVFARLNDAPSAVAFYGAVLRVAELQAPATSMVGELERAQAFVDAYQASMSRRLEASLAQMQVRSGQRSERFEHALDILLGRRQIYQQQPRQFFFPGLPQEQFHRRQHFPWLEALEAASGEIRAELMQLLADEQAFKPYVEHDSTRPALRQGGMLGNDSWCAHHLWKAGVEVTENARRCPATMKALSQIPMPRVPGRSPSALFSMMRPGAHIPPHNGFVNTRLIGHLGLVVPPGCRLRVGNETREWQEGKAWVFDDTFEHEAWNPSDQTRVILLFDVWPPALEPHERDLVSAMFAELEGSSASPFGAWTD